MQEQLASVRAATAAEVDRLAGRVVQLEAEVGRLQETQVSRNRLTNQAVAEAVARERSGRVSAENELRQAHKVS